MIGQRALRRCWRNPLQSPTAWAFRLARTGSTGTRWHQSPAFHARRADRSSLNCAATGTLGEAVVRYYSARRHLSRRGQPGLARQVRTMTATVPFLDESHLGVRAAGRCRAKLSACCQSGSYNRSAPIREHRVGSTPGRGLCLTHRGVACLGAAFRLDLSARLSVHHAGARAAAISSCWLTASLREEWYALPGFGLPGPRGPRPLL